MKQRLCFRHRSEVSNLFAMYYRWLFWGYFVISPTSTIHAYTTVITSRLSRVCQVKACSYNTNKRLLPVCIKSRCMNRRDTNNNIVHIHQCFGYRNGRWEGDDIRWISKLQRRMIRSVEWKKQPIQTSLILINLLVFLYQCMNTISWIRTMYPQSWPNAAVPIIFDTVMGNSRPGPFTTNFVYSKSLALYQPHRYITAGFLHGGIIHLCLNIDAIRQLPSWLEVGLGAPLYMTTYILAIIGGSVLCGLTSTMDNHTFCLGASGGICGLYGLMYVCLVRMGNHNAAWHVARGMGILFLWGLFIANVSNAGHFGGFVSGIVVAILCGPKYRSSYAKRRKNSLDVDSYSRDYRLAMGYDKVPSDRGIFPLPVLWLATALIFSLQSHFRNIPRSILHGLLHHGS